MEDSSDQVIIKSQRAVEVTWPLLATDRFSPYPDARAPLVAGAPEQREYRVQGLQYNARVGALSAVVSAVTVP
ncbi:MAG: hypothetical protein HZC36_14135 [Armatimonadetes bacterium]|nr:hypothetical protein [Armatimonadota bacterium]